MDKETRADDAEGFRLAADIGGTFTDIVLEGRGSRWSHKTLTTYDAPERAILDGIRILLGQAGIAARDVSIVVHGMTLATNAVLERRGARTALLTTQGFRDTLEIGYETRYDATDLMLVKQVPLVPRELRLTVAERISAKGEVLVPLDEQALVSVASELRALDVESLAIGFLHSYANGAHEERVRAILKDLLPGLSISISSEVCPEIREYERMSTVCANAYVQPLVEAYLDRLRSRLDEMGIAAPAFLMGSAGGIIPLDIAKRIPIRLIESGPAGGAVLSASIARELALPKVLSFDMGGTTAKICFIEDGEPHIAPVFEFDRQARFRKGSGLPLRTPVVELVEIGAGGGSIASIDALGRIAVGPHSAGSEPGPVSYGRGGTKPTVTDSDLVLSRLDPDNFAGGSIRLDRAGAERALLAEVGDPISVDAVEAAFGVVEIVDETMANAARVHAAELGRELSEHVMIAFGGAAPLHAGRLAEKLGISSFIVPRNAGVGSALGFLRAPMAFDVVQTALTRLGEFDAARVAGFLTSLRRKGDELVASFALDYELAASFSCAMRYSGQGYEIAVSVASSQPTADELRVAFEAEYSRLFGRIIPGGEIEVLSWQLRLSRQTWRPGPVPAEPAPLEAAHAGIRRVFEPRLKVHTDHLILWRSELQPGARFEGPAIVVEDETSTIVPASFRGSVDGLGNLMLTRKEGAQP
ncbi:hydantoinase/oxoprolinase family protein [Mesorhizobium australicum]|uniref:N-methylhydantoinase A n=1 Tax=Mesorhizobium australicum TaxID=536018 RepID=A0A1X7MZ65_9HYPH|nr:hydantoinase/oxoprolinase family protein [Mesorhizobium australicum]SMH29598.1 N-methylhydantoinase A [Mesorhizobium australicum]